MASLAFAAPASCLSTSFCGSSGLSKAYISAPLHTRARAVRPRRTTVAQYNYNIYQDNEDRSRRDVKAGERVVTVKKPLGLILEEGQDGMVFVAQVDPKGNAARVDEGEVNEGDVVVAVSATFGEEIWSTRGVGLDRVMKSIRVRAGDYVTLVLETPAQLAGRKDVSAAQALQKRTIARETRGEREVINPVTWTPAKSATFEDGDPAQVEISDELKTRLKNEIAAPYEQSWILYISAGIAVLALLLVVSGISG
jgi:hypothetical protein